MEIAIFNRNHVIQAAEVAVQQFNRLQKGSPFLSQAFTEERVCRQKIQDSLQAGAGGVAALDGDRLLGFILGEPRENEHFGRSVWSSLTGHALAEGVNAALYRQLYAAAGEAWVQKGYVNHYVEVPAEDQAALWTWFGLGFGQQQVYAALDLTAYNHSMFSNEREVTIRRAQTGDEAMLKQFAWNVAGYQTGAPIWAPTAANERAELEEGYAELATDTECITWLAFEGNTPVGMQMYKPVDSTDADVLNPENGIILVIGSTMPEARGKGVATLLTQHGLAYAREQGYKSCVIDWRATNLLSAAFWPKMGFVPVAYRLERRVDWRVWDDKLKSSIYLK